jgi:hypothetical protein
VTRLILSLALVGGITVPAGAQDAAVALEPGPISIAMAEPPPLSIAEYVGALDTLRADLERARLRQAQAAAQVLLSTEITWAGEKLSPDPTVLDAVARVQTSTEARLLAIRVRRLVEALTGDHGAAVVAPEPDVLSRVAPPPDVEPGGETPRLRVEPLTFPEQVEAALVAVADWIWDALRKLFRWLRRLWPSPRKADPGEAGATATAAVVFAVVVAVLLVVLAVRTLRRGGGGPMDAVSKGVTSSSRDEDPLSREASEWESYARELAGRRRWREAIRAWYHAVLVALFRAGVLHHQKGRTNWEYVSRLSPDLPWRPGFVSLTRRFDREWYGRRTSDGPALSEYSREAREVLRAVRGAEETT